MEGSQSEEAADLAKKVRLRMSPEWRGPDSGTWIFLRLQCTSPLRNRSSWIRMWGHHNRLDHKFPRNDVGFPYYGQSIPAEIKKQQEDLLVLKTENTFLFISVLFMFWVIRPSKLERLESLIKLSKKWSPSTCSKCGVNSTDNISAQWV